MFYWFTYAFENLFRLYLVIRLIDNPNKSNLLLNLFVFHIDYFGFFWTMYLILIYFLSSLIDQKHLVYDITHHLTVIVQLLTKNSRTFTKFTTSLTYIINLSHHLCHNQHILLIKTYGDYVIYTITQGTSWICTFLGNIHSKDKNIQREINSLRKSVIEIISKIN